MPLAGADQLPEGGVGAAPRHPTRILSQFRARLVYWRLGVKWFCVVRLSIIWVTPSPKGWLILLGVFD